MPEQSAQNSDCIEMAAQQVRQLAETRGIDDEAELLRFFKEIVPVYASLFNIDEAGQQQIKDIVLRQMKLHMDAGVKLEREHVSWFFARKRELEMRYTNRNLVYMEKLPERVVRTLDNITDDIMDSCGDPNGEFFKRSGLVIGDVQSGKTNTYTMLCCKAADSGYKLIILLTGTLENLRQQTQRRMDEGFTGRDSDCYLKDKGSRNVGVGKIDPDVEIATFTSVESDFRTQNMLNNGFSLNSTSCPVLFVMKKNSKNMANLYRWLSENNDARNGKIDKSILLIDDEADNASINTKRDDVTAINRHIRSLLNLFTKSTYIGFTATPFANIFIDPEPHDRMEDDDLFPKDFIYALGKSSNYIGPVELFQDSKNPDGSQGEKFDWRLIRLDDADDYIPLGHKNDFIVQDLPPSLKEAIRCFALTCVLRDFRGRNKDHMSMLINVSRFTNVQENIKDLVDGYLYALKRSITTNAGLAPPDALNDVNLRSLKETFDKLFPNSGHSWNVVQRTLYSSTNSIVVKSINKKHPARELSYSDYPEGLRVIAVGGNSLSRGLTLEGLTVSYFHRNSKTYDTLMQMGRWFGYRDGYADLCRIWMSEDNMQSYREVSIATEELKKEIVRMHNQGRTPSEFGLLVRNDINGLQITASAKMRHTSDYYIVKSVAGRLIGTDHLYVDPEHVDRNCGAVSDFISSIETAGCNHFLNDYTHNLAWTNVASQHIIDLLYKFESPATNLVFDAETLIGFIQDKLMGQKWDVCIRVGKGKPAHDAVPVAVGPLDTVVRTAFTIEDSDDGASIRLSRGEFASPNDTVEGLYQRNDSNKPRIDEGWKQRLEEQYITNYSRQGRSPPENVPVSAYLQDDKRNPLLIIYRFNLWGDKNCSELDDEFKTLYDGLNGRTPFGLALGFPLPEGGFDNMDSEQYKIRYKANRIYAKFGDPGFDGEEEDIDE